jgi:hypothetical protein
MEHTLFQIGIFFLFHPPKLLKTQIKYKYFTNFPQNPQLQPDLALGFLGCLPCMALQPALATAKTKTSNTILNFIIQKYTSYTINHQFEVKLQYQ